MATFTYTTVGTYSLDLPEGATNITFEIVGGKGGQGGTGIGHPGGNYPWTGGTGGYGQRITGTLSNSLAGKKLTLIVGSPGGQGFTYGSGAGGGGFRTGGRGGENYSESNIDQYGSFQGSAGGGGGGSSVILVKSPTSTDKFHVVTAGGGGGGGGGQYISGINPPLNGRTSNTIYTHFRTDPLIVGSFGDDSSNGATGQNSGASFNGAAGGGGGGYVVTAIATAYSAGNSITGQGGYGGNGYISGPYVDSYTLYTIDANNAGHTSQARVEITYELAVPPTIDSFTATATTISTGSSTTLSWTASSVSGPVTAVTLNGSTVSNNSSQTVSPTVDTTYTLSVSNAYGTVTQDIVITVLPPPVVSISLSVNPITKGISTSELTWSATAPRSNDPVTSVTITDFGAVSNTGTAIANPAVTTTYTISATNGGGTSTASVTLAVNPPPAPTVYFSVTQSTIQAGQSTTLNWSTSGVVSTLKLNGSNVANLGTQNVSPTTSTTYNLVATGEGGTTTESITITVIPASSGGNENVYGRPGDGSDVVVNVPENANNVKITLASGKGGRGGNDGNPGGTGGRGRRGVFYLSAFAARTLTFRIGDSGGDGIGCCASCGGISGGAGVASGGSGGFTGPQGCSGSGGGGGGATGVFDSVANAWIIVAGGGGAGGGASYPDSFLRGGNGEDGKAWSSTTSITNISDGKNGLSQGVDGGGGGGGGGGAPGGDGGREGADDIAGGYPSGGGVGGGSLYNSNYATFSESSANDGAGFVVIDYNLVYPSVTSISTTSSAIIRGASSTLSWTTENSISASIDGVGPVDINGSVVVTPAETTTYTLRVTGPGNQTTTSTITVVVYIPPQVFLSLSKNPIVAGGTTVLNWYTTGDADTIVFEPSIGNLNLTSSQSESPITTTTYTAYVSGLGGSAEASITLYVYQPPTSSITGPQDLDYGQQTTVSYSYQYANTSVQITPRYTYEVDGLVVGDPIVLINSSSASLGSPQTSGTFNTTIPYNNRGPIEVSYVIEVTGDGGTSTNSILFPINIDRDPTYFQVDETEDKYKDQEPVFTPETEILSDFYLVDDIDIDVEIKSNFPIKVDINGEGNWRDVRKL